jgi:hypothetical protein
MAMAGVEMEEGKKSRGSDKVGVTAPTSSHRLHFTSYPFVNEYGVTAARQSTILIRAATSLEVGTPRRYVIARSPSVSARHCMCRRGPGGEHQQHDRKVVGERPLDAQQKI